MAEIAVGLELAHALSRRHELGVPGGTASRVIARGTGWTAADVICTSGPDDHPFEERHAQHAIAVVLAGSFEYRSPLGRAVLTPGSLMLCRAEWCYECGHEHGEGDRCVSFSYTAEFFEQLASDVGRRVSRREFERPHIPPARHTARFAALVGAGVAGWADVSWEEIAVGLATVALQGAAGPTPRQGSCPPNGAAQVTRVVRRIEQQPDGDLSLTTLASDAGVSPFHFLRTFEQLTGVTPHQYVLRTRLRGAALRLSTSSDRVTDIAFDCGFGDVSNFNRAFRAEFGCSPREYRRRP